MMWDGDVVVVCSSSLDRTRATSDRFPLAGAPSPQTSQPPSWPPRSCQGGPDNRRTDGHFSTFGPDFMIETKAVMKTRRTGLTHVGKL